MTTTTRHLMFAELLDREGVVDGDGAGSVDDVWGGGSVVRGFLRWVRRFGQCGFVGWLVGVQLRWEAADELRPVDGGALRRGFYAIRPSGLASDDYSFTYKAGTYTINKADQTITFAALADKTYGDADFSVSASATSGLAVSFSASGDYRLVAQRCTSRVPAVARSGRHRLVTTTTTRHRMFRAASRSRRRR